LHLVELRFTLQKTAAVVGRELRLEPV
jgi:hypothetical protein